MKTFKQFLKEDKDWRDSLTKEVQTSYIKEHPNSKYVKMIKK